MRVAVATRLREMVRSEKEVLLGGRIRNRSRQVFVERQNLSVRMESVDPRLTNASAKKLGEPQSVGCAPYRITFRADSSDSALYARWGGWRNGSRTMVRRRIGLAASLS